MAAGNNREVKAVYHTDDSLPMFLDNVSRLLRNAGGLCPLSVFACLGIIAVMQHTATLPTLSRHTIKASKPALSIVAIHDDFIAGIRAQEALEWLKFSLGSELRVCPITWSFEHLKRLDLRSMSIRAAAAADVIIVSASDVKPLPDHIKHWLNSSLGEQGEIRPILVALHGEKMEFESTPGPLCSHLKRVAESWQTEFMCNEDFDRRLDLDFALQLIRHKTPDTCHREEPFGREFYSAPRYWGING